MEQAEGGVAELLNIPVELILAGFRVTERCHARTMSSTRSVGDVPTFGWRTDEGVSYSVCFTKIILDAKKEEMTRRCVPTTPWLRN